MSYRDINATFRPIDVWPGKPTPFRRRAPFDAAWSNTLELLRKELRFLAAKHVVIQIDMREQDIRQDGYPRANAVAASPGVILALESKYGPLRYPCDTFTRWEDNVRAIALALEALRKVDRYGVTKRGEQYTGWRALPGAGGTSSAMTAAAAAEFLATAAGVGAGSVHLILGDRVVVEQVYRKAAKRLHPDIAGGSAEGFATLGIAKAVLDRHHGRA